MTSWTRSISRPGIDGSGTMTKILVCIDGSIYAESVVDHAAWTSSQLSASVTVLHTLGRRRVGHVPVNLSGSIDAGEPETLLHELASLDAEQARLAQRRGRLILADATQRLSGRVAGQISERLRHGDVVDTLEEVEDEVDLVVIGKRGEAADFAKLHLGSNLERVLRGASTPVLVASRRYRPIQRCLIAFDNGQSIAKAIDFIAAHPLLAGVACHLLAVGPDGDFDRPLQQAAAKLQDVGLDVTFGRKDGDPAEVVAQQVMDANIDLLVMGAYGHSKIRTLIIGSTTTSLIRLCKVSALLFR